MKLYKAKIRLGGAVTNEVIKPMLTAAEMVVLQRIHGADSVIEEKEIGKTTRSDAKERARLTAIYPGGPDASGKRVEGPAFIDSIFGPGNPLPVEWAPPVHEEPLDDKKTAANDKEEITLYEPEDGVDPDDEGVEPITRTVVTLPKKTAVEATGLTE